MNWDCMKIYHNYDKVEVDTEYFVLVFHNTILFNFHTTIYLSNLIYRYQS